MFAYIVYGHILRKLFGDGIDEKIGEEYREGNIIIDRVRPVFIFFKYFFEDLGRGIIQALIVGIPLLLFLIFKTNELIIDMTQFVYFLISVFFAYIIYFFINYILGLVCFWTQSNIGIYMLKMACMGLFSGMYIPLEFYPKWLLFITDRLPFKTIYYTPLSLIIHTSKSLWYHNLLVQIIWIMILGGLFLLLQKAAFKKIVVQGG